MEWVGFFVADVLGRLPLNAGGTDAAHGRSPLNVPFLPAPLLLPVPMCCLFALVLRCAATGLQHHPAFGDEFGRTVARTHHFAVLNRCITLSFREHKDRL